MSKKVLLIYPRHSRRTWEAQPWTDIPMGLLCVATPLHHAGYQVKIIDQRIEPRWKQILQNELKEKPLCVGLSSTTGPQLQYALEVSAIVKENGNVPVAWGGVHPSILPEQTLQEDVVDIVVQGEGEATFLELVQALEEKRPLSTVKGIWYKEGSAPHYTGERPFINLDQQPPLAWELVEPRRYIRTVFGVERLSFFTSRGCPHGCAFCFNAAFYKRRWRGMDPDLAVQRMKEFVNTYNIKGVLITDNNFFANINWARKVLAGIVANNLNIILTRIHIDFDSLVKLNEDDFRLLEKAGCRCVSVGVESGSERIRTLLHKEVDVPRLLEINRHLKQYSFMPLYFFMIGFPTETKEELSQSIALFSRLLKDNPKASKSVNIYTPFAGTELFDVALKCGLRMPQRTKEWINFNYRSASLAAGWLSKEMRQIVEMVDFCSFFAGQKSFLSPFKKTNKFIMFFANIYTPIARKRLEHLNARFLIEVKLAKLLGLYANQS